MIGEACTSLLSLSLLNNSSPIKCIITLPPSLFCILLLFTLSSHFITFSIAHPPFLPLILPRQLLIETT